MYECMLTTTLPWILECRIGLIGNGYIKILIQAIGIHFYTLVFVTLLSFDPGLVIPD